MTEMLAIGRQVLASQPFSALMGAQLAHFAQGEAVLEVPISDKVRQQHGFVHGGVVSYAADNAITFAGGSVLGPGVVTSEFKINYLRPAVGDKLVARASVLHAGKTQAVCRCEIYTVTKAQETLCAAAQGTIARVGAEPKQEKE